MNTLQELGLRTIDLIHAGLTELDAAAGLLGGLVDMGMDKGCVAQLLQLLNHACDADAALRNLSGMVTSQEDCSPLLTRLWSDEAAQRRLIAVLGASDALGKTMRYRPDLVEAAAFDDCGSADFDKRQRLDHMAKALGLNSGHLGEGEPSLAPLALEDPAQAVTRMRQAYRRQLAAIMAKDLCAANPMEIQPVISSSLSDLADASLEAALAIARAQVEGSERCRFTIIGMGKLGAHELNYVSDVDLIYVVEPADDHTSMAQLTAVGSRLAGSLQKICQSAMPGVAEAPLWQIDTGLRPEGKDGPLVRRLEAHELYYQQWAQSWEFQALLKARPVAGDAALGQAYLQMTQPLVWQASQRENFVNDCQAMRKRVEDLIPTANKEREIKLGRGGLRDVEFTVQMLQLVHGRSDETLRARSTLQALDALAEGGYISRNQATLLSKDYRFERVLEHRQQIWQMRRTHLFPDIHGVNSGQVDAKPFDQSLVKEALDQNRDLRRLAKAFRLRPVDLYELYDKTRKEVRRLHMDIYYRPMLPINAQPGNDRIVLSAQATRDRFASIGFADVDAAMRHVGALTEGVSRASKINRFLLPAVLQWLGEGQNPDMGLLYWRKLEEHFGKGSPYLGFLRDSPMAAKRLCHVLSNSRVLGDALNKSVESITWLGSDKLLTARSRSSLDTQCQATMERYAGNTKEFADSLRAMRRQEIERIGLSWLNSTLDGKGCLTGMTDVYDAIIEATLEFAIQHQCQVMDLQSPPAAICLIAMGRYGGHEINFSSDADLMAFYRPEGTFGMQGQAGPFALAVIDELRAILQGPISLEAKIELDFDLRPEGKNGPLVRSYESAREYYGSWSQTWEHQALLRARYAAGDRQLAEDFLTHIADPLRYPAQPPSEEEMNETRKLKARMEAERLPRGVHRERHLKLGKGGLSDVEWTVQLLQLQEAGQHPELRVHSTLQALDRLKALGVLSAQDAKVLRETWIICTDARNGNYLWNGRVAQADIIPDDLDALGGMAVCQGYPANRGQYYENDLLALMRQCREVMERIFYQLD
ncbi:bifunctional glutamine-synthetase adenylyltransferase/deadenyltransferase [Bifidobacterium aemilianum]|uniref:Bifunctional glutamine-synthetase adenylyltransferase/deadenyltransferase n=1 Tax=Bifidobacterium aemilianum TaxID=2493120 RepID=A0A366KA13_9BIFI|nr:bifunctional [glutamine synthetase] adenylyltransferase/[glutamine synthetase]-adenylyl-L-tyrosine phosphorylase [Bifidobacterium aemilianum]RBP97998.1 bifunctional glutamine-synthetase adenylyltransferase/deadenyltransferase [Bifidobacterium aemilianum]